MKDKSNFKGMLKDIGFSILVALVVLGLVALVIVVECLIFGG
jgi:tetrahydromethanopterin S-methyltransferase subunit B